MKTGMSLENLLTEVVRQRDAKKDYVASTKEAIRMVEMKTFPSNVAIVLQKEGSDEFVSKYELERFSISENCHRQIAARLQVPWKYYFRLLTDHPDLVINQVNALFEREPQTRLLRTMDGVARAFLSDRYRTLDNDAVLEKVLPPIVKGDIETQLMSSNVTDNHLYLKVLFTDSSLAQDIGENPRAITSDHNKGRDIVHPGAIISNSETGHGSLKIQGFFYRDYCLNGCVWGKDEVFNYSRTHLGGKLIDAGNFEVFTDATKRKQDELIISEVTDSLAALSNPESVQRMGDTLRTLKGSVQVSDAFAAVDQLAKEVDIRESEKETILTSFLRDSDFSQWGLLNAVTEVANNDSADYERGCELEKIGAEIISMNPIQWLRIANAEKVAA